MPEKTSALIIDHPRIRLSARQTPSGMPRTQLISTAISETANDRMTIGRISWRTDSINFQHHRTVTFVVAMRRHDNRDSNLFSALPRTCVRDDWLRSVTSSGLTRSSSLSICLGSTSPKIHSGRSLILREIAWRVTMTGGSVFRRSC